MKTARMLLTIGLALVFQTLLARFALAGTLAVDLVLVAVVFIGLTCGPIIGIFAGTLGGLAQDALASGIVGAGGLAKTFAGFLAGVIGTQFIVSQMGPRFLVFFGATALHAGVLAALYALLEIASPVRLYPALTMQGLGNALVGVVLFQVMEMLPGMVERRRASRGRMRVSRLRD